MGSGEERHNLTIEEFFRLSKSTSKFAFCSPQLESTNSESSEWNSLGS